MLNSGFLSLQATTFKIIPDKYNQNDPLNEANKLHLLSLVCAMLLRLWSKKQNSKKKKQVGAPAIQPSTQAIVAGYGYS